MGATSRSSSQAEPQPEVVVVDYGMGNVRSVQRALERLGCRASISGAATEIARAEALVLPGVGAFGRAMENLVRRDLRGVLDEQVMGREKPILGICLGMQLFADTSEELGHHRGLGWIPGHVERIDTKGTSLALPHVGWSATTAREGAALFDRVPPGTHFYFDHTFHLTCAPEDVLAVVDYGTAITAAVRRKNVLGVQFHPEKSQTAGLKLLRSYLTLVRAVREGSLRW